MSDNKPTTASSWPIGVSLLPFSTSFTDGHDVGAADASEWAYVMHQARAVGFDHVELSDSWLRVGDLSARRLEELGAVLAAADMSVVALAVARASIGEPDAKLAQSHFDYASRSIDAAAQLGIKTVCLGLHRALTPAQGRARWFWLEPNEPDEDSVANRERIATSFRRLGRQAGALGVALSLEIYEDTLLGTSASAIELIERIGLDNVGLNPDVANIVRLHRPTESWYEMYRALLPYANYWHVKNYFLDYDPATGAYFSTPASLQMGYINYRTVFEMALQAGYRGALCMEHYGGDGLGVGALNRDYVRSVLATLDRGAPTATAGKPGTVLTR